MNDFIDFQNVKITSGPWTNKSTLSEGTTVSIRRSAICLVTNHDYGGPTPVSIIGLTNGQKVLVRGDHYTVLNLVKSRPKA